MNEPGGIRIVNNLCHSALEYLVNQVDIISDIQKRAWEGYLGFPNVNKSDNSETFHVSMRRAVGYIEYHLTLFVEYSNETTMVLVELIERQKNLKKEVGVRNYYSKEQVSCIVSIEPNLSTFYTMHGRILALANTLLKIEEKENE